MMRVQIFFASCHTAAQMTLSPAQPNAGAYGVVFQNRFDLGRKTGVDLEKSFGDILMYRCNNYNGFYWCIA